MTVALRKSLLLAGVFCGCLAVLALIQKAADTQRITVDSGRQASGPGANVELASGPTGLSGDR